MKHESQIDFGHVAVLMGGVSAEREVSLESGNAVYQALTQRGVKATLIDTAKPFVNRLINEDFDRAFIALHGGDGESGTIQGFLATIGMPYTGCDMAASALAMDKPKTKIICNLHGVPTPRFECVHNVESCITAVEEIGLPVCIKPVYEGSSIGVTRVDDHRHIDAAYALAAQYGPVMVEKWIEGSDITVSILNENALPSVLIRPKSGVYDYEAKYLSDETEYLCPAPITQAQSEQISRYGLMAYEAIGGYGWGRVDFIIDKQNQFWLLEVNTIPGMTSHSLVPMAAKESGMSFDELVMVILESSMNRSLNQSVGRNTLAQTG